MPESMLLQLNIEVERNRFEKLSVTEGPLWSASMSVWGSVEQGLYIPLPTGPGTKKTKSRVSTPGFS